MQLEKCIISGFKSFAERTEISFGKGASIIVGPNGSGKSNILDAISWVLGEQNPRHLRGTKMEDVIFAGTTNRVAIGMAEVSLFINNAAKTLPFDQEEIVVTRRLFRSGKSEYLLNGSPCRNKDITNLFLNTGLGKNAYAFIGQGEVDKILQAKPQELRLLFEEVAGIARYKAQKQFTESQLSKIQLSMQRVDDLITELKRDLPNLQQKAEAAQNYQKLQAELQDKTATLCLIDYQVTVDKLNQVKNRLQKLRAQQEQDQLLVETIKAKNQVLTTQKQKYYEEKNEREKDIIRLEMAAQACQEQIKQYEHQVQILKSAILQDQAAINKSQIKIKHLTDQYQSQQAAYSKLQAENLHLKQSIQNTQTNLTDLESYLRANNIPKLEQSKSELEAKLGALTQEISRLEQDVLEQEASYLAHQQSQDHLQTQLNSYITQEEMLKANIQTYRQKYQKAKSSLHQLEQESVALDQKRAACEQELNDLASSYHQLQSRLQVAKRMAADYTGYHQGVRSVMKAQQQGEPACQGVIGVISELIEIPDHLYTAMNAALGSNAQFIVTKTAEDAIQAIQYLLRNHAGRATFLPISNANAQLGYIPQQIFADPQVIGRGSDCVTYAPRLEPVIKQVLGRILVVKDRTTALRLTKQYKLKVTIVTLEGDVFRPSGTITGGKTKQKYNEELLQRQKQIKLLERKFKEVYNQQKTSRAKHEQLREEQEQQKATALALKQRLQKLEQQLQTEEKQLFILNTQQAQLQEQFGQGQNDLHAISQKLTQTREQLAFCREAMQTAEAAKREMVMSLEQASASTEKLYQLRREFFAAEAELKYGLERETYYQASCSTSKEALDLEQELVESLKQKLQKQQAELNTLNLQLNSSQDAWNDHTQQMVLLRRQVQTTQQNIAELTRKEENCRQEIERLTQAQKVQEKQATKLAIEESKLTTELRHLEGQLYKLNLKPEDAHNLELSIAELNYAKLKKEQKAIKEQLNAIGKVDESSITSYQERCSRIDFLENQKEDLLVSANKLMTIITETDQRCHSYLAKTIDEVNTHFQDIFQALFRGGIAEVIWEKAENIFKSGIIIKAQPPGKKLQHIALLSGGEKALTAIALLLAFFKIKPSAFCIMDEIDAPLDESNNIRLAEYLATVAQETQMIIISHSPHTMQIASQLYGVVMEEQGVSKIISVSLEER